MIQANTFKDAIISAANSLSNNRKSVDELNIFPVPDGDTGTNMSMTVNSAATELSHKKDFETVSDVATATASAMLSGARGNSGVITSLLFRGFAKGLKDKDVATGADLANALTLGVEAAYKAVMKPTEGTILTVARIAAEKGRACAATGADAVTVWKHMCDGAQEALAMTPDLLPVLKKVGVVDAGGKGLTIIMEGMRSVFETGTIVEKIGSSSRQTEDDFIAVTQNAAAEYEGEITFTYCTEYIIERNQAVSKDPLALRAYLETIGDCVVVVDDESIIKVHVHTDNPGKAIQHGLEYGMMISNKIENMRKQHENARRNAGLDKEEDNTTAEPTEEYGFVSVCSGDGIASLFTDLGVNQIVSGGQTMNPSTDALLKAILKVPAKTVFVLPNNKNIIMAAEQTIPLATDRKVVVVPTKTIPQGITAMMTFDPDASDDGNLKAITEAIANVSTGQVTFAARDSEFNGRKIKQNEIIALDNGKLVFTEKTPVKAAVKLARNLIKKDSQFVTVFYGGGITEDEANEAVRLISSKIPDEVEITVVNGGQPIYYFIISVE